MTESQNNTPEEEIAGVDVSQRSGFSIVWVIPLVALAIGAWMTVKAYMDQGPIVTIQFKSASGVIAEKTKVRMRDVQIGVVESVVLSEDMQEAIVQARLTKESEKMLVKGTRFWIESPRVSAGEIRGLQTLLSGVFIGIDPAEKGDEQVEFIGLDEPPFIVEENQGSYFTLHAERRGSINIGSPIIYRGMDAGQVVSYKMNGEGSKVDTKIFIEKPYDSHVNLNSRFWESSGIKVSLSADGLEVDTESVVSIISGGISFGTPKHLGIGERAPENHEFEMFADHDAAFEQVREKYQALFYFNGSVRGLKVGAPVDFRGIRIGEVVNQHLEIAASDFSIRIPVLVELEHGHFKILGENENQVPKLGKDINVATFQRLVDNGMRAQLKTGSLITGALYIDFDLHKDVPPAEVVLENSILVLPTVPTALDAITTGITTVLNKIAAMPLEQIGHDLGGAIKRTRELLESDEVEGAIQSLNATLKETETFAKSVNTTITPQLDATLRELKNASRSIKAMADYLERHPEALIKGKAGGK